MPTCMIDGKKIEFKDGMNLVEVAKLAGIEIPIFCYHPGLSVVAQCRMCAVEIEKMPKLQTACSTKASDGMVVSTKSEKARKNQQAIMEFLLLNHPLDCPICDKAGECDLQDYSYQYGDSYQRTTEERRTYIDGDIGPVIQKNMNRCIHCTRCIRFGAEVAGIREMVAIQRGGKTEITTLTGQELETEYAGNYADICPTGSLTLKDFRFKKRAWMLKHTVTVCEGCSRGCAMEVQHYQGTIYRCVASPNPAVNGYWICDEGRFNYKYVHNPERVIEPSIRRSGGAEKATWSEAIKSAQEVLRAKNIAVLIGSDLTQEEATEVHLFAKAHYPKAPLFHFGTAGVLSLKDDGHADKILKMKSKTANLFGLDKLGIKGLGTLPSGTQAVMLFRAGRAVLPEFKGVSVVAVGVFNQTATQLYNIVLPSEAFVEKEGTIFNFEGREQRFKRAILPPSSVLSLTEILALWDRGE